MLNKLIDFNVSPIKKHEFYILLKDVYIDEINWEITKSNPSNLRIENGQLIDDFYDDASYFGFCLDGKPVFGFRLIMNSKEIIRYSTNHNLLAIQKESVEVNRLVIHPDLRRMGSDLVKLTSRLSEDFIHKMNMPYCVTATDHKALKKRYQTYPNVKVLEKAIQYPEGSSDAYIFPPGGTDSKWNLIKGSNHNLLKTAYDEIVTNSGYF
ncbi:hypothetical protein [Dokdonia sp. R86516]|uniref:hypothetical protein n=1 Tax=Dokdonia sp. R86516 TaxID=3093856 RepID=UPI0037CC2A19